MLFTDTLEEDGQVVMVVKLHDIDLPKDSVLGTVFDGDGKVTSVVETSKFRGNDRTTVNGTSDGLLNFGLGDWFKEGGGLSTETLTFLKGS